MEQTRGNTESMTLLQIHMRRPEAAILHFRGSDIGITLEYSQLTIVIL